MSRLIPIGNACSLGGFFLGSSRLLLFRGCKLSVYLSCIVLLALMKVAIQIKEKEKKRLCQGNTDTTSYHLNKKIIIITLT